jgi:aryl-alcohol dehydrogenase-like predicted oxidoreductase
MRLTRDMSRPSADRAQAISVLRRAVDLGVNHIDTASFYFSPLRSANELINSALAPYPDDLVITTKVWAGRNPSGEWSWAEPHQLRGQVEENLRQLGRDCLDVVNLRIPPSAVGKSIGSHFAALVELHNKGLIRHLGVSNATAKQLAEARALAPVVCVQNRYGLEASSADHALLDRCGEQGIAFVPFFAIAGTGGSSSGSALEDKSVAAIAKAHDATPAQIRLAWTLHRGRHVLAIPGTSKVEHLTENVEAAALRLSSEEIYSLAAAPLPTAP